MKTLQKILAFILILTLALNLMGGMAFAEESEGDETLLTFVAVDDNDNGDSDPAAPAAAAENGNTGNEGGADGAIPQPEAPAEEEETPYWTEETELEDGTTQTVTHAVLDSEGELVNIGEEAPELDTSELEPGNMTAQKHGAFENEDDAENGIVKLTFDVAGKPVDVESPVDLLIIDDESGSLNMYGRADTYGKNISYMPCLNGDHYYSVDGLQSALYDKAVGALDQDAVKEVRDALAADSSPETEASAVEQLIADKSSAVSLAEERIKTINEEYENAKAGYEEAQAKYDAEYATASPEERDALDLMLAESSMYYHTTSEDISSANADLQAARNALDNANSALELLNKSSASQGEAAYINPHKGGLENIVFSQWRNEENRDALVAMIEAAGLEVPDSLSAIEIYDLLFPNAGATPDKNHYYYDEETGTYKEIPYVENNKTIPEEEGNKVGGVYSYWSPDYENEYGCIDRMIMEKLASSGLAESILENPNSSVGYIGFTYSSYPSLCSGGFMTSEDIDELLDIIEKTEGHDYTNYAHALWTAKNYIENREDSDNPVYIVFISDGAPNRTNAATDKSWNTLEPPVKGGDDGDCLGYNEIYYGDTDYTHVTAAMHIADELKKWYNEQYGAEMDFFTVGINTNEKANEVLGDMASDDEHFIICDDPNELADTLLETIDPYHVYPSGVLTDVIGEDFELYVDDAHLFTVSGQTYDITAIEAVLNSTEENAKLGNVVSFQVKLPEGATSATIKDVVSITWEVNEVDENGDRISYYVQLKSEELDKFEPGTTRLYDTNADSATEAGANLVYYELSTNEDGTECFVAKDPTTVELWTPQMMIVNTETSPDNPPQDPPAVPPVENPPVDEITEEPVPLAEAPGTGSISPLLLILAAASGTGLVGVNALSRKKKDEE